MNGTTQSPDRNRSGGSSSGSNDDDVISSSVYTCFKKFIDPFRRSSLVGNANNNLIPRKKKKTVNDPTKVTILPF